MKAYDIPHLKKFQDNPPQQRKAKRGNCQCQMLLQDTDPTKNCHLTKKPDVLTAGVIHCMTVRDPTWQMQQSIILPPTDVQATVLTCPYPRHRQVLQTREAVGQMLRQWGLCREIDN
ncbi:hypothetical protein PR048_010002 [Dryococelus australis]|uniref:Uncharacterized protein n=1 Tax=Dryococelus australis TaxID=614101 RepID=A0ABQ9I1H6_9NEOP|nr:hypothetical protein PR048_010002 [Dryococelus australis]